MRSYFVGYRQVAVKIGSLCINDKLNARTTCSFTVIDPAFTIEPGMDVQVYQDETLLFAGTVLKPSQSGDKTMYVNVSSVDYSSLLDRRVVVDSFSDKTAGYMVREFIAKTFSQEGITPGDIQDGPTIAQAVFNYVYGTAVLKYLTDLTGYNWRVDNLKQFHFFERSTYQAPFDLTDTGPQYHNLQVEIDPGDYRNRQIVRAGKATTDLMIGERPTPAPDGVSQSFITRLPIASKPQLFVDGVEVPPGDIGVTGIDSNTRKWYFSYNSNTITQDLAETPLAAGTDLQVNYAGLYPLLFIAEDASGIEERKAVAGGSGIYDAAEDVPELNTLDAVIELAQGRLARYGLIQRSISFTTREPGLLSGQLIHIQNTFHGIDDTFLIDSVVVRDDGALAQYNVRALDGASLGGWEQVFRRLIQSGERLTINENEVIVTATMFNERAGWAEQQEATAFQCSLPSDNLYPSEELIPC